MISKQLFTGLPNYGLSFPRILSHFNELQSVQAKK